MGLRFLFLIISIIAIWLIVRHQFAKRQQKINPKNYKDNTDLFDNMVECHYCSVHIPRKEAFFQNEHYYCSLEHADNDKSDL